MSIKFIGRVSVSLVMEDTKCGLGSCQPKWLKNFATAKSFMAVYGLLGTIQAMAYVYLVVTLTTMEKRYKIPSRTTGIILTGNEISQILLSLILSYHGAHRKRPQWIAWGVGFSALSCFIVALPHFIYGPGHDALQLTEQFLGGSDVTSVLGNVTSQSAYDNMMLCVANKHVEMCESEEVGNVVVVFLVFLSQFVLGIGNTLYFSLGQTYLDDNTKKTRTPILLGWTMALRTLGPVIGFVLGYICLSLYIEPSLDPVIDKKDPRWLGAWWMGWIFLGTVMLIFVIPVAMFPQYLPIAEKSKKRSSKYTQEEQSTEETAFINNTEERVNYVKASRVEIPLFKDFPAALKRLLKNKLLMYNNLSGIFYILGASGYITYISKYIEVQFQESAVYTVITGPITLVGMVGGFLISGYVISKYKPGPKWLLGWNVLVGFVYVIGESIYMFLDCPITDLHSYSDDNSNLQLIAQCNSNCSCGNLKYSPVCSVETWTTYYSPCHAGCTTRLNDSKTFGNCMCTFQNQLQSNLTSFPGSGVGAILKEGPCLTDCTTSFYTFVFISFVINLMGSSGKIGNLLVNYRSVDIKDKSFAQGLALWMISLMALIPGPIMYGIIIDSACLVWDESCGKKGNCWTYDRHKMRFYLNATAIVLTSIGMTFDIVVWYLGRSLNLYDLDLPVEPEETNTSSNNINNVENNKFVANTKNVASS